MCDYPRLTECLFEGLPKFKEGQRVFVVASRNPGDGEIDIESVLYGDAQDSPQKALNDFCQAQGLDMASRLCIPVILPPALKVGEVGGFKAVRVGSSLHIEFTK